MLLQVENLEVKYGNIQALHGISFHVEKGEIVTLIGANGAGKTTTLHSICRLPPPEAPKVFSGDIRFKGESILTTPPHFRPMHLRAAINANKHVFAEKPVAVDAPGVRSVLETCRRAKQKGLCVVSGLCLRYSYGFQAVVRRIRDGAVGRPTTLYANDYRGAIWLRPRQPG